MKVVGVCEFQGRRLLGCATRGSIAWWVVRAAVPDGVGGLLFEADAVLGSMRLCYAGTRSTGTQSYCQWQLGAADSCAETTGVEAGLAMLREQVCSRLVVWKRARFARPAEYLWDVPPSEGLLFLGVDFGAGGFDVDAAFVDVYVDAGSMDFDGFARRGRYGRGWWRWIAAAAGEEGGEEEGEGESFHVVGWWGEGGTWKFGFIVLPAGAGGYGEELRERTAGRKGELLGG